MNAQTEQHRDARRLFISWILLLAFTMGSYWLAEGDTNARATATAGAVLGIAALKGHLIAGVFMEMTKAPRAWAITMSLFIASLTGLLILIFST